MVLCLTPCPRPMMLLNCLPWRFLGRVIRRSRREPRGRSRMFDWPLGMWVVRRLRPRRKPLKRGGRDAGEAKGRGSLKNPPHPPPAPPAKGKGKEKVVRGSGKERRPVEDAPPVKTCHPSPPVVAVISDRVAASSRREEGEWTMGKGRKGKGGGATKEKTVETPVVASKSNDAEGGACP